ncbi:galectin-4 isoform X2 [Nasonia vitripennis]|uniref:Galectin n=1 Tax=Nasonia vitripennis TaxID=7425 RepID=A0A7M7QFC1_NASVI|nr:galectin-4 isoform X2 [Nasonia vitripennis]
MSREWLRAVVARRNEAFNNFQHVDPEAVAVNVSTIHKLNELKPTSAIIVTGYIPIEAIRFSINLKCKTSGNIALHFNPRLDRGYVVRNSKFKGCWDVEETCSPAGSRGYVFRRNSFFHLTIFCTINEFQIAIDGEHFCAFAYRMPLEEIVGIEFNDDVEEPKVRQTNISMYPDPQICKPTRILELLDDKPLDSNLELPIVVDLPKGFGIGAKLLMKGRLKLLPHSFYINLQKGKMIYPHPAIALHLNPRYHYGNQPSCLVMNCWNNGKWDREERHDGQTWCPGREFLLTIRCEYEGYVIWLNDRMIGEFKHRLQPSVIDTIRITGDLVVYEMLVSYS